MKIKIAGLADGDHKFIFDEAIEKIELEEPFFGNFRSEVMLNKSHSQIIADITTSVNANFDCDRCGRNYNSVLNSSFRLVFLFEHQRMEAVDTINTIYLSPEADQINIKYDLRDYAVLSIPMKKLCKENCKGLCVVCGKDLNEGSCNCQTGVVDERWKPLLNLKKQS
ncbi:MAG: DUF177 domain-containing protein [Ignavibacteriaceae bacterium]